MATNNNATSKDIRGIEMKNILGIPNSLKKINLKIIRTGKSAVPYIGTKTAVKDPATGKIKYKTTSYGRIIIKNNTPFFISLEEYAEMKNSAAQISENNDLDKKTDGQLSESTDKRIAQTPDITDNTSLPSKLAGVIENQNTKIAALENTVIQLNNSFKKQITELTDTINLLSEMLKNSVKAQSTVLNQVAGVARENEWAHIFNNTIFGSSWLKDSSFSPGRWAVGYQFLYVMYRILNEVKPKSILELGLGQSTKMISQYIKNTPGTKHWVVEHDQNWIDFFSKNYPIPSRTTVVKLPWDYKPFKEAERVRCYKDFSDNFKNKKFDFISIDGPLGGDMKQYARIDTLSIIPKSLNKDFVIMIDDTERSGEINMIAELEKILSDAKIEYAKGSYQGEKKLTVICSKSLSFVRSM